MLYFIRIVKYFLAIPFLFLSFSFFANSQTIDESVSRGLANSSVLSAASLEWASLREKLNQSSAGKEIIGTLKSSFSETYSGTSGDFSDSFSNSITATLSKKLYDGGVSKASEKINRLKIDQKSLQIKLLEQDVILKIINLHLDVFLSKKIRELREQNIIRAKEQVDANKARYLAGAINRTVLAESEARLARAFSQLIEARVNQTNSIEGYISLVGETPGKLNIPSEILALPTDEKTAIKRAEKHSINIALSRLNLSLNKAQYDSLISSVMPGITTSLSGSISDSTRSGPSEGVTFSLSLSSPIFYTPATSSKNREIVASAKALNFNLEETIKSTMLNVKLKMNIVESKNSIINAVEEELKAAKIAAEATRKESEFGAKTILDVLDADVNVLNSEISVWKAKSDLIKSSYDLLAAIGELHTGSLGLSPTAPQYKTIEIIAPPLPSPFTVINPNNWIN